jgi:hypothetical protein
MELSFMVVPELRKKVRRLRKEVAPPTASTKEGLLVQLPKLEAAKEAEEKVTAPAKMARRGKGKATKKRETPKAMEAPKEKKPRKAKRLSPDSRPAGTAEAPRKAKKEEAPVLKVEEKGDLFGEAKPAVAEIEKHTEAAAHEMVKAKEAAKKAPKAIKKEVEKAADVIAVVDDKVSDATEKAGFNREMLMSRMKSWEEGWKLTGDVEKQMAYFAIDYLKMEVPSVMKRGYEAWAKKGKAISARGAKAIKNMMG